MAQDDTAASRTIDWAEGQLRQKGLLRVLALPIVIIGIFTTVGVVTNLQLLSWAALAAATFAIAVFAMAVNMDRRHFRELARARGQALSLYGKRLTQEIDSNRFEILHWKERELVGKRGSGTLRRWMTIKVSDSAPLEAFWSVQTTHSDQMREGIQSRVSFRAYASDESGKVGPSHLTTLQWDSLTSCRAFVHLDRPLSPGSTAHFYMEWRWPRHFSSLLAGKKEPFNWVIRRPVQELDVRVSLRSTVRRPLLKLFSPPAGPQASLRSKGTKHVIELNVQNLASGDEVAFDAQFQIRRGRSSEAKQKAPN